MRKNASRAYHTLSAQVIKKDKAPGSKACLFPHWIYSPGWVDCSAFSRVGTRRCRSPYLSYTSMLSHLARDWSRSLTDHLTDLTG